MKRSAAAFAVLCCLPVIPASAQDEPVASQPTVAVRPMHRMRAPKSGCMQETVNLNVNFNLQAVSFSDAKAKYDDKMAQVEDFARKQNVEKFDPQSLSYSVNAQSNGTLVPTYQLSGNSSYQLSSAETAFALAEFLTKQNFQVSVSVNQYRNGNNCPTPPAVRE